MAWNKINKNTKAEGNIIERETTMSFKESECKEIVTLYNKNQITTEITKGPIVGGKKIIILEKSDKSNTRINVKWDIRVKGLIGLFTIIVKKHIFKGTEEALNRITYKVREEKT